MADKKFSQLTAKGAPLAATDLLPISEVSGAAYVSKSVTGANIRSYAQTKLPADIFLVCSDETTILTTGTKLTFRMPYRMTLTSVRASLTTAQASGNIFTVDVHENGVTIFSTKLTIDNTEKTSTTAATRETISDNDLADDSEIQIIIDQVGNGTAAGLKVWLIGERYS